jgi:tetrapyrrole methylase family protein/MazG family protein
MEATLNGGITIIGLGPGDPNLITRQSWEILRSSPEVYLRTNQHPAFDSLASVTKLHTFDALYVQLESYEAVYAAIVEQVLAQGRLPAGVVYAVPGDPGVGEATVAGIRERAGRAGISLKIHNGVSFLEPCLNLAGHDALDGLFIADALEVASLYHPPFTPDRPALIGQLYSRRMAGDVKLTLMNQYPDEHPVKLIHSAGSPYAMVENLPLYEMDRSGRISSLTALWVPRLAQACAFESFQGTVAHLRAPEGCPWDREQTHQTLRQNLLEETYEALQAIDSEDVKALREELGDLLLQIVLHAQIATEDGDFRMGEVISGIQRKIVDRHPHVFGDVHVQDADEVIRNWERIKAAEREQEGTEAGVLSGVPSSLPALAQAHEIQRRAARYGLDWQSIEGVMAKLQEELEEVREAGNPERRSEEIGDLLFSVVNYARWLQVDAESALRQASSRFRARFARMEREARSSGRRLEDMDPGTLDALWEAGKGAGEG